MGRQFKHLSQTDRLKIEKALREGKKPKQIAKEIRVHISTIYREIERGKYEHRNSDWTTEFRYSSDLAEMRYQENLRAKGAGLKIGSDHALASYIENRIISDHYSPRAVLGEIRREGIEFSVTISVPTLYSYIDKGIFLQLTNKSLPQKWKKKRKYRKVQQKRPPRGDSIEKRPAEIETREIFGHWEMDTVKGLRKGKNKCLLVLTERKTRKEIVIEMPDCTAASTVAALDTLERGMGELFPLVFKTITIDNGSEFADCEGIERSCIGEGRRTKAYYCHPYSSWERGSNEKQNSMIRRFIPKGQSFNEITQDEINEIAVWINNYPRGIFDYDTSERLFKAEMEVILALSEVFAPNPEIFAFYA